MTTKTPSAAGRWRRAIVAAAVIAAAGAGGLLAWAADSPGPTTAPAEVTPANRQTAVMLYQRARELFQEGQLQQASEQNRKAMALDPGLTDAQLLQKILDERIAAAHAAKPLAGAATEPSSGGRFPLLTPQQISMIRLQELSPADTAIRGRIPRKVLDEFWNTFEKNQIGVEPTATNYGAFVASTNFPNQVRQFRRAADPRFSAAVEITSDPVDMIPFRSGIHQWVMQNCATAACHGGEKAGRFRLVRPFGNPNDAIIYTNFYILSTYVSPAGEMLNRDSPQKSLLLQYALPHNMATPAHPGKGDVHRFGQPTAPEFQNIARWIKSLAYPRPNYGIAYQPPGEAPATAPAEEKK